MLENNANKMILIPAILATTQALRILILYLVAISFRENKSSSGISTMNEIRPNNWRRV